MPTNDYLREKIIRIMQSELGPVTRRELARHFNTHNRVQADAQIGLLLSQGVLISTGLGTRGSPETIEMGQHFPARRCPFCLRDMIELIKG